MFLGSAAKREEISRLKLGKSVRVALVGRSNVGKSSLINGLFKSAEARVSRTPGKTQLFNFFKWDKLVLVDLPGYGFAKVPKAIQARWATEITGWLLEEQKLGLVVVLVDGRHGFFEQDLEILDFLQANGLPFLVAFTKMDKWKSKNQQRNAERKLIESAKKYRIEDYVFTSANEKNGLKTLRNYLKKCRVC